ncbi:MAG: hypothetical protein P8N76_05650 [Pirellulaceae bacterium]|nr:hypothetical protein [Pirellulaceae bacterium]
MNHYNLSLPIFLTVLLLCPLFGCRDGQRKTKPPAADVGTKTDWAPPPPSDGTPTMGDDTAGRPSAALPPVVSGTVTSNTLGDTAENDWQSEMFSVKVGDRLNALLQCLPGHAEPQ